MTKPLDQMTNQELWQLFPIELQQYDPGWKNRFDAEALQLMDALTGCAVSAIYHIGSTSVPGLTAKPIIDMIMIVEEDCDFPEFIERMTVQGYILSPQPENPPPHMTFLKGYTTEGYRGQAFHLHIRYPGDWDELYFCRYLRQHPETAREYEQLKLRLAEEFRHDRDAYTEAKTGFIERITALARSGR